MKQSLKLVQLQDFSILDQLHLEETLLRSDVNNWCLINQGTLPALVMGRTQKTEEVIDSEETRRQNLSLIRRFSGGGAVVVDEHTIFFTLILNKMDVPCNPFPQDILSWSHLLLKSAFPNQALLLQGQDFAIENKKIGGNAQSIIKDRFLQHTSFLWSWDKERMKALSHPPKEPDYRQKRSHEEFLDHLKNHFSSKKTFIDQLVSSLLVHFNLEEVTKETLLLVQKNSNTKRTQK